MALGTPASLGVADGSTSAALSSATPTAGHRIYACVFARGSSAPPKPTISDTQSLTWTEVEDFSSTDQTGNNRWLRATVYTAVANGSATVITGSCSGVLQTMITAMTYSGAGSPSANAAGAQSATGDPSVVLSAPAGASGILGFFYGHGTAGITPPTDYAESHEGAATSPNSKIEVCWDNSSPSSTVTWSTSITDSMAIAVEIPEAATGVTGSGAATTPAATASGTATVGRKSTGAATTSSATASGTATVTRKSTGAADTPPATASGLGKIERKSTGDTTTPAAVTSGSAASGQIATGATTTPKATASGTVSFERKSSGATTTPAVSASGSASRAVTGSGATTTPETTASGSAASLGAGEATGDAIAPSVTAAGTAERAATSAAASVAPRVTASGTAEREITGSGACTTPSVTASGYDVPYSSGWRSGIWGRLAFGLGL